MRTPSFRYADDLKEWDCFIEIDGKFICCRPEGYHGLLFWWRLRMAWNVFTGRYDVLVWKGGQSKI